MAPGTLSDHFFIFIRGDSEGTSSTSSLGSADLSASARTIRQPAGSHRPLTTLSQWLYLPLRECNRVHKTYGHCSRSIGVRAQLRPTVKIV